MTAYSPHQTIVYGHLHSWRNLNAWGKSLDHVDLTVSNREYPKRAGSCWPELQKVVVYYQPGLKGLVGMIKTGLHELAHTVEVADSHGARWQKVYARAVTEVTGHHVVWGLGQAKVDEACYKAVLKWWRQSGNEASAKRLLGL